MLVQKVAYNMYETCGNKFILLVNFIWMICLSEQTFINKCCEKFEIIRDKLCIISTAQSEFQPTFLDRNVPVLEMLIGDPICESHEMWSVYDYDGSEDKLVILNDGTLRHYVSVSTKANESILDSDINPMYYDYILGQYCIDKGISNNGSVQKFTFAKVCSPLGVAGKKNHYEYFFKKILKPAFNILCMIIYILIAIVYFILPTLRDLMGNIISTICLILLINQAANFSRDLQLSNLNYLILDIVLYTTFLSAFFWLTALGFNIRKQLACKNLYLRVEDGKTYVWYCVCIWGLVFVFAILTLAANFLLDIKATQSEDEPNNLGKLGITIMVSLITISIMVNFFFHMKKVKIICQPSPSSRIQKKLHFCFKVFFYLFVVITINWMFFMLSVFDFTTFGEVYSFSYLFQAFLLFYVCVLQQSNVKSLLNKKFCDKRYSSNGVDCEEVFNTTSF